MVTGIEATGLVLALLPLLVNQLDNYVQGLETLKGFTAKRYRRELETYLGNLGAQQAIFLNTLEQALDGVIDDEDEIRRWMRRPDVDNWKRAVVHDKLEERLGRSFDPFIRTTTELSRLLEDIASKLDLNDPSTDWHSLAPSALGKEVKKFRHILSKSVYADLFSRIHTANSILKTLVEQSHHQSTRKNKGLSKRLLLSQKRARTSASSLYNSIMSGRCWRCPCRDQHSVRFVLNASLLDNPGISDESEPRFRMVFASKRCAAFSDHTGSLHEVEAKSHSIPDTTTTSSLHESQPSHTATSRTTAKVRFQIVTSEPAKTQPVQAKEEERPPASMISDICFTLSTINLTAEQPKLLGCVADEKYRHNMYYLRTVAQTLQSQSQSLGELIAASSTFPQLPPRGKYIFGRRDRLLLAVRLACSVLTFHGSWLRKYWRAQDIMFANESQIPDRFNHPYIICDIANGDNNHIRCKDKAYSSSPLIRNEILFPLGLILVELSLCQTLEALRTAEDTDALETVANLKTAARYLPAVEMESGLKYGEVVNHCLFGSCAVDMTLDNEAFQREVFQTVISPLAENLRDFDGNR